MVTEELQLWKREEWKHYINDENIMKYLSIHVPVYNIFVQKFRLCIFHLLKSLRRFHK